MAANSRARIVKKACNLGGTSTIASATPQENIFLPEIQRKS